MTQARVIEKSLLSETSIVRNSVYSGSCRSEVKYTPSLNILHLLCVQRMSFIMFMNWDTSINPRRVSAMSHSKIIFYFDTLRAAKAKAEFTRVSVCLKGRLGI